MAYLFGGSLLLWIWLAGLRSAPASVSAPHLLISIAAYERYYWVAAGLIVLTGVGNLGVFGSDLPGRDTRWGTILVVKLSVVLLFLAFSFARGLLASRLGWQVDETPPERLRSLSCGLYAATALFLAAILALAVTIAHG